MLYVQMLNGVTLKIKEAPLYTPENVHNVKDKMDFSSLNLETQRNI